MSPPSHAAASPPVGPKPSAGTSLRGEPPSKGRLTRTYLELYGRLKVAVGRRVGCPQTAEDIVQEAWLRLAARDGEDVDAPEAFVFRVAGNLAVDQHRQGRRRTDRIDPDAIVDPAGAPSAERQMIDRQTLQYVLSAANTLPPRCREVFVMRKLEGVSQAEIAERLGISRNMVEKHLRRALETLSAALDAAG